MQDAFRLPLQTGFEVSHLLPHLQKWVSQLCYLACATPHEGGLPRDSLSVPKNNQKPGAASTGIPCTALFLLPSPARPLQLAEQAKKILLNQSLFHILPFLLKDLCTQRCA